MRHDTDDLVTVNAMQYPSPPALVARPWVALYGPAGVGKDSLADVLVREYDFVRVAFADPVREMALRLNPYVHDVKTTARLRTIVDKHGWEDAKNGYPEVRRLLQVIGTDAIRTEDPEFWVRRAKLAAQKAGGGVVFTDTRFVNEARMVSGAGGITVRIEGPMRAANIKTGHKSENGMGGWEPHLIVSNPKAPVLIRNRNLKAAAGTIVNYYLKANR